MKIISHPANRNYLDNWQESFTNKQESAAPKEELVFHVAEFTPSEDYKIYHGAAGKPGTFMKTLYTLKDALAFASSLVKEPWFIARNTESGELRILFDHQGPLDKTLMSGD